MLKNPVKAARNYYDTHDCKSHGKCVLDRGWLASVRNCLSDEGMFVTHSESLHFHKDMTIEIQEILKKVFPLVDLYSAPIATYPGNWWAFSVASKRLSPREVRHKTKIKTKYYSDEIHQQSFMPKGLYEKLMQRKLQW